MDQRENPRSHWKFRPICLLYPQTARSFCLSIRHSRYLKKVHRGRTRNRRQYSLCCCHMTANAVNVCLFIRRESAEEFGLGRSSLRATDKLVYCTTVWCNEASIVRHKVLQSLNSLKHFLVIYISRCLHEEYPQHPILSTGLTACGKAFCLPSLFYLLADSSVNKPSAQL